MATFTNTTKNTSTSYSNVTKATTGDVTTTIGMATGLVCPPTYATELPISSGTLPTWINVNKN